MDKRFGPRKLKFNDAAETVEDFLRWFQDHLKATAPYAVNAINGIDVVLEEMPYDENDIEEC